MILSISVVGRPAPQGSKRSGSAGQLLEQSSYLPAWRRAVRVAAYRAYARDRIDPAALPLFAAGVPVYVHRLVFRIGTPLTAPPDLDKLTRATLDGLTEARAYADDSQVVGIKILAKVEAAQFPDLGTGADIILSDEWETDSCTRSA